MKFLRWMTFRYQGYKEIGFSCSTRSNKLYMDRDTADKACEKLNGPAQAIKTIQAARSDEIDYYAVRPVVIEVIE